MGYERRVWDQEGTICPAPVTARKPSTCKPFSDEEASVANCGKQRRKAQFAHDCIPGLEPVTKASWQVTICRGVHPEQFSPQWNPSPNRTLATRWDPTSCTAWQTGHSGAHHFQPGPVDLGRVCPAAAASRHSLAGQAEV